MNMHLTLVSHSFHIFEENILPSLTSQQKKILGVVLTALTCLAACLYYYMRKQKIDKKILPMDHQKAPVQPTKLESPTKIESPTEDKHEVISLDKTLLLLTTQPLKFSVFDFGGDDTKKPGITAELIAENAEARMKIVEALGGQEACKKIPLVECPKLSSYLDCFNGFQFPEGYAIVQGEDQAGRKFVLMRLEDKVDKTIFVQKIFQRRRETCIVPDSRTQDGCGWVMPTRMGSYVWGADEIAPIIEEIMKGTHPTYTLAPQTLFDEKA